MLFELKAVGFRYAEKAVIEDINLTLAPGKFYGIIGPNGSGKTTLLDLLTGHRRPAQGSITYQGRDLASYPSKVLSRQVALVPQNFYINFPFTVREVVMMGRYPHIARFAKPDAEDIRIVDAVMKKTGTVQFAHRFITELSGGERQRVIFARALAQDTPVLILDEATSNLDVNYGLNLLKISAKRVKQDGKTVISVMQDINLAAAYCDDLVVMSGGRVVAQGAKQQVLNPDTIRSVFNVESKVYWEPYAASLQVVFKH
jgi:iron complex transport system ATP-binding protein